MIYSSCGLKRAGKWKDGDAQRLFTSASRKQNAILLLKCVIMKIKTLMHFTDVIFYKSVPMYSIFP